MSESDFCKGFEEGYVEDDLGAPPSASIESRLKSVERRSLDVSAWSERQAKMVAELLEANPEARPVINLPAYDDSPFWGVGVTTYPGKVWYVPPDVPMPSYGSIGDLAAVAVEAKPPGPRKPLPALCVEAHNDKPVDIDAAHAATLALCRGQ